MSAKDNGIVIEIENADGSKTVIPKNAANSDYRKFLASGEVPQVVLRPPRGKTREETLVEDLTSATDFASLRAALLKRFAP